MSRRRRRSRSRSASYSNKRVKKEKDRHVKVKKEKDPLPHRRKSNENQASSDWRQLERERRDRGRDRDDSGRDRNRHRDRVKREKRNKVKVENKPHPQQQRRADEAFQRNRFQEDGSGGEESDSEVEQPNFVPSGALKKGTHLQKNGTDLKYLPPPEASLPGKKWRFHVFKDSEQKRVLHLHRKDHFIFGRDRKVCEIDLHHISVSSQHAALQYRLRKRINAVGEPYSVIVPYLMDLESKHGTKINGEKMIPRKYYELLSKDVISFGLSSRKYVWLKQDEVKIDYDEATVTNKVEKTKVKLAEVKSEKKEFVDVGASKPKKLKELKDDELWDL